MDVTLEKLIELREKENLTLVDIVKYYKEQGIKTNSSNIYNMLRQYFLDQEKISPESKKIYLAKLDLMDKEYYSVKSNIKTEGIAKLAEQGLIYQEISQYYKGNISVSAISERLKRYYDGLGQKVPKKPPVNKIDITDAEILELKNQGMTYQKIADYYNSKGVKISIGTIKNRLYNILGKQDLAKIILNLVQTKNATPDQIKEIADLYGVDLEETLNSLEER